jgi:hypothetical protein
VEFEVPLRRPKTIIMTIKQCSFIYVIKKFKLLEENKIRLQEVLSTGTLQK